MNARKGLIELAGMHFKAFHGCLEIERQMGGEFVVDFCAEWDISRAASTDDLSDTLDYSSVYAVVASCMERPCNLLEAVAGRIAEALSTEIPGLGHFRLKVSKKNPPVGGDCEWASVTLER